MSSQTNYKGKYKNKKNLKLNDIIQTNYVSSRENFNKTHPNRKNKSHLSKVILKGKLFGLINKTNIMTDEQFNDIKIKLSLSQLEKYKINKKKLNEKFYYAQRNPNILTYYKSPNKFEDDYINMKDLLNKEFTPKEQKTILSFPQFFQLNSNAFLKELVDAKHKNLYEIIGKEEKEEKDEIERRRIKKLNMKRFSVNYANSPLRYSMTRKISSNDEINDKIDKLNNKNKNKSRNVNYSNSLFKNNNTTTNNKSTNKTSTSALKTFNEKGKFNFPSIKHRGCYFHKDIENKYKILSEMLDKKNTKKYENMKKRKEAIIQNNKIKMNMIKEKNIREQSKKEQERLKIYHEKKYIEYIVAKLKKNYIQANMENEEENDIKEDINKENDIKLTSNKNVIELLQSSNFNQIKSSLM